MSDRRTAIAKNLRRRLTDAERRLWNALRAHQLAQGKFKRQQPIGPYIVDFVCLQARVVVEVDGGQHLESKVDRVRDAWLEEQGFRVLRFWNNEVLTKLPAVLERIVEAIAPFPPPLSRQGRGVMQSAQNSDSGGETLAVPISEKKGGAQYGPIPETGAEVLPASNSNELNLLHNGVRCHQVGDLTGARRAYEALLAQHPEHPDAWHLLGLLAQVEGDIVAAESYIGRAIALQGGEPLYHFNLANLLRDAGRGAEAEAAYRQALALRPDDTDSGLNLGSLYASAGDWSRAVEAFEQLLQYQPGCAPAWVNLGLSRRARGESGPARAAFERALVLDANDAESHFNLGLVLHDTGETRLAREHYEQACALAPGHARAWNNLGIWHQEQGGHAAAEHCYRQALHHNPEDAESLNNLGTLLAGADRLDEAEARYRHAIARRADFAEAHKNLGAVLATRGRHAEALACYREALRWRPDFSEAAFKAAALSGEAVPDTAPSDYVAALFDGYAADYDRHLTETLRYNVPEALAQQLAQAGALPGLGRVFDLGCGTGLSGLALRRFSGDLMGIDLSARMLDQASARGLYNALLQGDLEAVLLAQPPASGDMAMAADVFVYVGDLEPVARAVARVLRPGGWLAFSVESSATTGYRLQASGRYAHSARYVEDIWTGAGLTTCTRQAVTLRVEQGQPVAGMLWVFRRPPA